MTEEETFRDLIQRIRAGDQQAAAELVNRYEAEIRRAVRIRLSDPSLNRVLDSMDICQSVLANFFVRANMGQFDLERPEQLLGLLVTMAKNKLKDQARKQHAKRRGGRGRVDPGPEGLEAYADPRGVAASGIVSERELLEAARNMLTEEERYLADQRALQRDWADIAKEHGGTPEALRKKLQRRLNRVCQQLGLEHSGAE